jgi:hypothetical protein
MPNWNNNVATLTATTDEQRAILRKVVAACLATDPGEIFAILKPMPTNIFRGDVGDAEREIYGANNWYDWANENWGTKWDTTAQCLSDDGDSVTLFFDTAWSPPIALYNSLVNDGWGIFAYYYEPGMAFAGIYDNGNDRCYGDLNDDFLNNDDDGIELADTFGILDDHAEDELNLSE